MIRSPRGAVVLVLPLVAACATASPALPAEGRGEEVRALEAEYLRATLSARPEEATRVGWPLADHGAVTDVRPGAIADRHRLEDALLARARALDPRPLAGTKEGLSLAVLVDALEGERAVRPCAMELWDVSPTGGWLGASDVLAELQPVGTPARSEAARARLTAIARRVDHEIENLREGIRRRLVATRENVERTIGRLDRLLGTPPSLWPQVRPAARADDPALRSELTAAVERELLPAAQRYRTFLATEYLERARWRPSLLALPGGESCYRGAVRRAVTLEVEPAEVHATGLAGIEEVHAELRGIAARTLGTKDAAGLLRRLREDPAFRPGPRAEVASIARAAAERAAREGGPRIGAFLPSAGFSEGWALYGARHAAELGLDVTDADRLEHLAREALGAARLVVDSGLNVFGWPRQRAIDFLVSNAGLDPASASDEADRCLARPGEGTAGALGARELRRLREEAERALGDRFDARDFHGALLAGGPVPIRALRGYLGGLLEAGPRGASGRKRNGGGSPQSLPRPARPLTANGEYRGN